MSKTTLLVDGNAVAYTINISNCIDAKDFAKQYFNRLREYAKQFTSLPKMILFIDDKIGGTWRNNIYPDYQKDRKAQKEKYTEEQKDEAEKRSAYIKYLKLQISKSKFDYISYPHTETDDLVALYCNNIQQKDETVTILTTDKDLFQLIREKERKVQILFLIKRQLIKSEEEGRKVKERKIMLGDNSDSIPSVCKGVGEKYYPDFKQFLIKMKEQSVDPTDKVKAKSICESLGIKYINSFSNFDAEQLKINRQLVDLNTVCKLDAENNGEKTEYIKSMLKTSCFSPFSLYNIKLD